MIWMLNFACVPLRILRFCSSWVRFEGGGERLDALEQFLERHRVLDGDLLDEPAVDVLDDVEVVDDHVLHPRAAGDDDRLDLGDHARRDRGVGTQRDVVQVAVERADVVDAVILGAAEAVERRVGDGGQLVGELGAGLGGVLGPLGTLHLGTGLRHRRGRELGLGVRRGRGRRRDLGDGGPGETDERKHGRNSKA
jgi:hypothetical protein